MTRYLNRVFLIVVLVGSLLASQRVCARNMKVYIWQVENSPSVRARSYLKIMAPDASNRTNIGVIICPGGSYAHMMGYKIEGEAIGEWFAKQGITAFVLRYRVAEHGYHHPAMIEDFQKSMDYVRRHAEEYGLDPNKIGAVGFSAGGHLALMSGVFGQVNYLDKIGIKTTESLSPNFIVAVYPVVSMQDSLAHMRSRRNFLGKNFTQEQIKDFSLEGQDLSAMPPVFLTACLDDHVVNYKNSLYMYQSLRRFNIQTHLQLYDHGSHGYGINPKKGGEAANWNSEMLKWLKDVNILN